MRIVFSIVLFLFLTSCLDTPACIDTQTSNISVELKSITDGSNKTINIDSIYIVSPEVVIEKEIDLAEFTIPVLPDNSTFLFVIQSTELEDSISIDYKVIPKLFAAECDIEMIFSDFSLNSTTADSLRLSFDEIPPRIEIFF